MDSRNAHSRHIAQGLSLRKSRIEASSFAHGSEKGYFRHMRRVLFVTTLVLIAGTTAFAASVRLLSLSHLVNDSSLIIVAKTLNSTSYWSEHRIYTDFELEPIELWKGQLPPAGTLNLTLLGGIVGELGQYVPGTPKIESNTTYLFYLQPDLKSRWRITGLYQGIAPVDLYSPTPIPGEKPPEDDALLNNKTNLLDFSELMILRSKVQAILNEKP